MPIYKLNGKKDGLQKYNVRINYNDENNDAKQLTRTAYGLDNAKELERRLQHEIKESKQAYSKKYTVQELYSEYLLIKKHEVRASTLEAVSKNSRLYILPTLGKKRIDKLSPQILQHWKLLMEEKDLSSKTKQGAFSTLRAFLNFAVDMEYIPVNPLKKIKNFKSSLLGKTKIDYYTAEEFKKYAAAAKKCVERETMNSQSLYEWNFYVFFNIAFYTGLRKGEIHGLEWGDIQGEFLSVTRSITQKLRGGDIETPPKNATSIRTLQIPTPLMVVLEAHKIRQMQLGFYGDTNKVLGSGRGLRDTTIDHRNRAYALEANVKRIRVHDFRHSHASLLANAGINIQEIARRLGHSKIEITWNTYSHLYPREEERAVKVLNAS